MTLEQLRIFVAVAERQHVTRAAESLNLAQSVASAAIASLESRHGTRLFHRVGRNIALTEPGRAFLDEARAVLARAAAAKLMLGEFGGLQRGSLAVCASQTVAGYWLPRHLTEYRRAHPGIELRLTVGNTAQVAAAVPRRDGRAGPRGRCGLNQALLSETVARDQLVPFVAADHPWAGRTHVELAGIEWVLREPGSGTRSVFEAALARAGLSASLRVALELPSNEAVRAAVEAGAGATVISAFHGGVQPRSGTVAARPHDSFGVVAFSTSPIPAMPLTAHRDAVSASIRAMAEKGLANTDIGAGVAMGLAQFDRDPANAARVLLLVSDGAGAIPETTRDYIRAAARRSGAHLYYLYLRGGDDPPLVEDEDESHNLGRPAGLDAFFRTLGGTYAGFEARDPGAIAAATRRIGALETQPIIYRENLPAGRSRSAAATDTARMGRGLPRVGPGAGRDAAAVTSPL